MYTVVTRMQWLKRAAFPFTKATNSFWKKLAILLYFSSPVLRACAAHFQALWPLLLLTGARIQEILLAVGAASSSPPRHIYLCKYITSTSTSSEVWTYTECLVWFGLAIDQWELRWLSIIFRPMRRELTKFNKSKLSAAISESVRICEFVLHGHFRKRALNYWGGVFFHEWWACWLPLPCDFQFLLF